MPETDQLSNYELKLNYFSQKALFLHIFYYENVACVALFFFFFSIVLTHITSVTTPRVLEIKVGSGGGFSPLPFSPMVTVKSR